MTKDEALEMCLEYIVTNSLERRHVRWAIKEALAQPVQEPVSWGVDWGKDKDIPCACIIKRLPAGSMEVVAVEYGPPHRPWLGLTDEEIIACDPSEECWGLLKIARAIEAKLKEKNYG